MLYTVSIWALPVLIAITFHEAAHAFVARLCWRSLDIDGHVIASHLPGRVCHHIDEVVATRRAAACLVEHDLRRRLEPGTARNLIGLQLATTHKQLPIGRHRSTSFHSITQPGTCGRDGDAFGYFSNSHYSGLHTHYTEIAGSIRGNDRSA